MRNLTRIASIGIVIGVLLLACAPAQTPTATPISPDVISSIDAYLGDLTRGGAFSGSVLIAQGDTVLLSAGYGMADIESEVPNTPQTRFHIGSVTKQFTALAVLTLQAQGQVDLEDQVCNHVPDCPDHWQAITIHQLLTHSSGLPDSWQFYAHRNKPGVSYAPEEIIGWFKAAPLDFAPGDRFSYSNTGYLLLGYLVEEVSGQSYEVFLRQQIFEPLEMTNTGYAHDDTDLAVGYSHNGFAAEFINPSLAYSAGGLYSTVEDLYRWDRSFYTEELVPPELLDTVFTPFLSTPHFPYAPPYDQVSYGYGWFVGERLGRRVAGHGGTYNGFRALIERYPDDEIAIVILSNLASSDNTVTTFPVEAIFGVEGRTTPPAGDAVGPREAARFFTIGYEHKGAWADNAGRLAPSSCPR
ncbi:MAG: serine hydrolase domain-containing protein [Promethearchaeota archaeon]